MELSIFENILLPDRILKDSQDLAYYGKDSCKSYEGAPSVILMPQTVAEVQAIVKTCNDKKIPIVPSGGRTGYSGGATATNGEVVLSLSKLNRIFEVNSDDRTLRCEAGAVLQAVQKKALDAGFFYPVDIPSKGSAQIGGTIATNAGGIRVIRYGTTRDWVLGVSVITTQGELRELNGSLVKNQTGYDLRQLMIGSEGTLAIVVEAILKVTDIPQEGTRALCAIASATQALEIVKAVRSKGLVVSLAEYFERNALELVIEGFGLKPPFQEFYPAYFLIEVEGPKSDVEKLLMKLVSQNKISDVIVGQSESQNQNLLSYRELISEAIAKKFLPHKNDISVPIPSVQKFVEDLKKELQSQYANYQCIIFGHLGDGNLHINVLKPEALDKTDFLKQTRAVDERIFKLVSKYQGSVSAEHGIGLLKRDFLHYSRSVQEIELMHAIKKAWDPNGILNPGKLL